MNQFAANLMLALVWMVFFGGYTFLSLTSGFILGYGILWLLQPLTGVKSRYFLRVYYWLKLIVLFLYELIVSSLQVSWEVLTPGHNARPAIIDMPLDVKTDAGILLVTNLISLTPGTLSIDVSEDRKTLLVHAMFGDDPDAVRHALKSGMEKWVIDALEGKK